MFESPSSLQPSKHHLLVIDFVTCMVLQNVTNTKMNQATVPAVCKDRLESARCRARSRNSVPQIIVVGVGCPDSNLLANGVDGLDSACSAAGVRVKDGFLRRDLDDQVETRRKIREQEARAAIHFEVREEERLARERQELRVAFEREKAKEDNDRLPRSADSNTAPTRPPSSVKAESSARADRIHLEIPFAKTKTIVVGVHGPDHLCTVPARPTPSIATPVLADGTPPYGQPREQAGGNCSCTLL